MAKHCIGVVHEHMKSSAASSASLFLYNKKERCLNMGKLLPFLLTSLGLTTILSLFLLYSPNPFKSIPKLFPDGDHHDQSLPLIRPQKEEEGCDLFKGHWIPDLKGPEYTNWSCATIPESKNCFRNGRKDRDFLNWRWKPDQCELQRFDPKAFLETVRGKTLAFIGDSVARNHMESLLCHLSKEEVPKDVYKDSEDRERTWYFVNHDFTLRILWTKFLVFGQERVVNGSASGVYDLYLDKIDNKWGNEIQDLDYIVLSDAHWFFRPIYLHKGSKIVACVYCNEPNVTDRGVNFAVKMAFRAALSHINHCKSKKLKNLTTILRTFSPSHFENGYWNTGGSCNRTSPIGEKDIKLEASEWELRSMQIEELEMAKKKRRTGKKFGVLDVTRAMLMRPDGHPGEYWGNKWMKGYNDCVHWCLPGPVDFWNDFLLAILQRLG